jgi:uncharacterized protein involved in exopolysaccharide biosynthesis
MSEYIESPSSQNPDYEDEIDLRDLIKVLWQRKFWVIGTTFIAATISVAIALWLPNIYQAEALLAVTDEGGSGGLSSLTAQYGGLASLAGISLPAGESGEKAIGLAKLQSRQFMADFMERHNILPDLMAASAYNVDTGELSYDPTIFDPETRTWTRDVAPPLQKKPSSQEAFIEMAEILTVTEDNLTGFVTVSIEHLSPLIAYEWVTWLIEDLNREMMLEATAEAQQSVDYLTDQLERTQVVALEQVFYALIEEQTKTIMLANSRAEYLFKTIDPAIVPEIESRPSRALISVLGTLLGGILIVLWVLTWHYAVRTAENA